MTDPITVMRSELKHYLNTGTAEVPVWSQINKGVVTATINWNPQIEDEAYIGDTSSTKFTTGLAPEMPMDMSAKKGDPAYDFVAALIWNQKIGIDAETDLLTVDASAAQVAGVWPAKKQRVSVSYSSSGGDSIKPLKQGVTLQFMGDPEYGTYNPTTGTYTKDVG